MTLERPPLVPTDLTPEDIIGPHMARFKLHFEESLKVQDPDKFESTMKKFSQEDRDLCSDLLKELRRYGYWPCGISGTGKIKFATVLMGDLQRYVESMPLIDRNSFDFRRSIDNMFEIPRDTSMDQWPEKEQTESH